MLCGMPNAAAFLRAAREEAGLTQAELGALLGRSQAAISALERPGSNPRIETIQRIMQAVGRTLELRGAERKASIDPTLNVSNLKRTPAERLAEFDDWQVETAYLRAAARRSRERYGWKA
jgi:transcriptional regulator with XRE-family HTH domain